MKYPVILFDADGVLIKSQYLFSEKLEAEYGISAKKLLPFFTGVFKECTIGKADLKVELAKVIDEWGWKGTVNELLHFWFTKGTEIDEEVAEFVRELRRVGVRTHMTTDNEKYRGEALRKLVGGGNLFDEIFFSAEVGYVKKDPAFFEHVYRAVNQSSSEPVDRSRILFIDDSPENVEVAKRFGFDGYVFVGLAALKDYLAE